MVIKEIKGCNSVSFVIKEASWFLKQTIAMPSKMETQETMIQSILAVSLAFRVFFLPSSYPI
jgi:hypothetical protein